jgi:hypothetical protein
MSLSNFWQKHDKKIFKGLACLSPLFMIPILGELTGVLKNDLLLNFFLTVDSNFPMFRLYAYYARALVFITWLIMFFIIHLKYFTGPRGFESIQFNKLTTLALVWALMFIFISPLPYVIHFELLTQFGDLFYDEDGVFETLTSFFFFLAFLGFFYSGRISRKKNLDWKIVFAQFFLGCFCLFFCMEEISWGQRFFSLETPDWMSEINSQEETNLHNICDKVFKVRYCLCFMEVTFFTGFSLAILYFAGLRNQGQTPSQQGLFRLAPYYFLAIIMAVATLISHELNEELLALFFLNYSYDVLKFYRNFQPHQKA